MTFSGELDPGAGLSEAGLRTLLDVPEVVIYPAGNFTGSQLDNKFPARAIPTMTAIAGGAAGDHTVTGLGATDDLAGVLRLNRDGTAANIDITDISAEFTVTAADTINNTGGTNTTGDSLLVSYSSPPGTQLTGMPFPDAVESKAAMPLLAPLSWATVDISILGIATSFGSGNVRMSQGGTSDAVTIAVAASFVGELAFPTGPTWAPGSGVLSGFQFAQLILHRDGGHVADTLTQGFAVLFVVLTPGA